MLLLSVYQLPVMVSQDVAAVCESTACPGYSQDVAAVYHLPVLVTVRMLLLSTNCLSWLQSECYCCLATACPGYSQDVTAV